MFSFKKLKELQTDLNNLIKRVDILEQRIKITEDRWKDADIKANCAKGIHNYVLRYPIRPGSLAIFGNVYDTSNPHIACNHCGERKKD